MALQNVAAGQDEDWFAALEATAVGGDVEQTIGLRGRSKIAGALPLDRCDVWRAAGPSEPGREKMREAGFLLTSFEKWEWLRFLSSKHLQGERSKEFESDHCRDGISGKAEDGLVLAGYENGRFARANGYGVKVKYSA